MATAWEPASPADSGSEGLWPTANWMSPLLRDRRRSASKLLTASTPSRSCFHDSSRTTIRTSPGSASSRMPRPQRVQAGQGDADRLVAERFEPGQAQRLDRRPPVDIDGGVVVEQAGEGAGDQLAEGVAEQPGLVEEMPSSTRSGTAATRSSVGSSSSCHSCGMVTSRIRAVAVPVAGQVLQGGLDDDLVGGPERHPVFADALAADQPADQGEPAAENDRGPALRLFRD